MTPTCATNSTVLLGNCCNRGGEGGNGDAYLFTCSMSGYAQQPGRESGATGSRNGTAVCRFRVHEAHVARMSPEVLNMLKGHQSFVGQLESSAANWYGTSVTFGMHVPQWQFSVSKVLPVAFCSAAYLKVKNGRKNVKSAPYRPILSANRRR